MEWMGLHVIDWIVLAVYLIGITVVGVMAYLRVSDMEDFFMGGRRFGKIFMMFFAFGAGTSSDQASSVAAGTWRQGLAGIWWQFLWLWATPFYWIIAPLMRRMRALTTSDFFEARYGKSTAGLYAVYGILMTIVFIGSALYGSGKMADALTGGALSRVADSSMMQKIKIVPQVVKVSNAPEGASMEEQKEAGFHRSIEMKSLDGYQVAILIITVLFVTYGMAGGLAAAIWTDLIQGILTIVLSFLLLPWIINIIGGFGALKAGSHLKEGMFDLFGTDSVIAMGKEPITFFFVFVLSLTGLCGIVVQPHIMGVCGAGKTEYEGRFGFTVGNFIKRFCTIAWTFTALAAIVWYLGADSPLKNSDVQADRDLYAALQARASDDYGSMAAGPKSDVNEIDQEFADRLFGRAAYDILPTIAPGLVGLLLASLLAAMMSTCDAQMIVGSGLFTENIYRRFFVPGKSQKHYLWVGRFAALGIVLCALILQTTFTDVIGALKFVIKTPAAIGISLWIGICWRRWTTAAVWVSSITAYVAWWFVSAYGVSGINGFHFLPESMLFMKDPLDVTTWAVSDTWTSIIYLSAGALSGLVVSYLSPRESKEKLDYFFRLMRTPVREGEIVNEPCTLPEDPEEPIGKLFNHPDIEIPMPDRVDIIGFALAWVGVAAIVGLVVFLAR